LGSIDASRRALLIALGANAVFFVVELVGGFAFGSLALLADAAHMVSDVVALSLAFAALVLAQRPPTDRHTYGFARAEVLVAQANGMLLIVGAIAVAVEAARRIDTPHAVSAAGVLVVGGMGLVVNLGSALALRPHAHESLNMRGALWHLVADALGSFAVVVAAAGVALWGADRLDPIASLVIAVLVVAGAWRLVRDATRVLLEAVPAGLDVAAVRAALEHEPGVDAVHHLHLWTIGSAHPALSAHVVLGGEWSLHDAQERAGALKQLLAARFGIEHATLEIECHACVDDDAHAHPGPTPDER
jgi:cobalt-zinc-cadmium efflux system protein